MMDLVYQGCKGTFMKLRYLTLLLGFTFVIQTAKAQDYSRTITWQAEPKTFVAIDGKVIKQPTFSNAAHSE